MSSITLDITNALPLVRGVDGESLDDIGTKLSEYNRALQGAPYPFMNLPTERFQFEKIKDLARTMRNKGITNLVVLGIGGSSLGTQTIFDALLHPFHNAEETTRDGLPRYFILDNIDPRRINHIIEIVEKDPGKTFLIVVSKSGETAETMSQFMIFKSILEKSEGYKERIVLITDRDKGLLNAVAGKEGFQTLNLPDGVGGRFSVLTPVGFFPAAALGIDIDGIAEGASAMACHVADAEHPRNMAICLASLLYLMERKGKHIHVMMPYCERLAAFADWFRQLEAESLGKNLLGPTPLKSVGVTDQHSQLQLYMEGPRDKFITFLYSRGEKRPIPDSFPFLRDELDYLAGKDLSDLFHAEFQGTVLSLSETGIPNVSLNIERIDGYTLGALFFLYEMVIAFMGRLYEVNAFDQPGVELGKIYSKALMGKKGLESRIKAAKDILSGERTVITF